MRLFRNYPYIQEENQDNNYLLEYRLSGYPRKYFKDIHSLLQRKHLN